MVWKKIAIKISGFLGLKSSPSDWGNTPQFFSAAEPQQHDTNDHRIELMDTTTWWFAHSSWKLWNVQAKQRSLEDFHWASDLQLVVLRHPLLATAPGAVDVFMLFFLFRDFLSSKMMPVTRYIILHLSACLKFARIRRHQWFRIYIDDVVILRVFPASHCQKYNEQGDLCVVNSS